MRPGPSGLIESTEKLKQRAQKGEDAPPIFNRSPVKTASARISSFVRTCDLELFSRKEDLCSRDPLLFRRTRIRDHLQDSPTVYSGIERGGLEADGVSFGRAAPRVGRTSTDHVAPLSAMWLAVKSNALIGAWSGGVRV